MSGKGHGGKRPGAGRPAVLSENEQMLVALRFEERWSEVAEEEAQKRYYMKRESEDCTEREKAPQPTADCEASQDRFHGGSDAYGPRRCHGRQRR